MAEKLKQPILQPIPQTIGKPETADVKAAADQLMEAHQKQTKLSDLKQSWMRRDLTADKQVVDYESGKESWKRLDYIPGKEPPISLPALPKRPAPFPRSEMFLQVKNFVDGGGAEDFIVHVFDLSQPGYPELDPTFLDPPPDPDPAVYEMMPHIGQYGGGFSMNSHYPYTIANTNSSVEDFMELSVYNEFLTFTAFIDAALIDYEIFGSVDSDLQYTTKGYPTGTKFDADSADAGIYEEKEDWTYTCNVAGDKSSVDGVYESNFVIERARSFDFREWTTGAEPNTIYNYQLHWQSTQYDVTGDIIDTCDSTGGTSVITIEITDPSYDDYVHTQDELWSFRNGDGEVDISIDNHYGYDYTAKLKVKLNGTVLITKDLYEQVDIKTKYTGTKSASLFDWTWSESPPGPGGIPPGEGYPIVTTGGITKYGRRNNYYGFFYGTGQGPDEFCGFLSLAYYEQRSSTDSQDIYLSNFFDSGLWGYNDPAYIHHGGSWILSPAISWGAWENESTEDWWIMKSSRYGMPYKKMSLGSVEYSNYSLNDRFIAFAYKKAGTFYLNIINRADPYNITQKSWDGSTTFVPGQLSFWRPISA